MSVFGVTWPSRGCRYSRRWTDILIPRVFDIGSREIHHWVINVFRCNLLLLRSSPLPLTSLFFYFLLLLLLRLLLLLWTSRVQSAIHVIYVYHACSRASCESRCDVEAGLRCPLRIKDISSDVFLRLQVPGDEKKRRRFWPGPYTNIRNGESFQAMDFFMRSSDESNNVRVYLVWFKFLQ